MKTGKKVYCTSCGKNIFNTVVLPMKVIQNHF